MACRRQGSDLLLAGGRHWGMVQLHVSWDFVNHYECLWVVGFCFTLYYLEWGLERDSPRCWYWALSTPAI